MVYFPLLFYFPVRKNLENKHINLHAHLVLWRSVAFVWCNLQAMRWYCCLMRQPGHRADSMACPETLSY